MNHSDELAALTSAWCSEAPKMPAGLATLVRRQSLWMRVNAAVELLISAAFMSGSFYVAIRYGTAEFIVLAIAIWMITLTALIYSFENRVGTWAPEANSTRDFLALSRRRYQKALHTIRFALWLLLTEVLFLACWHVSYWWARSPKPGAGLWLIASILPAVFLVALLVLRELKKRQLARLQQFESELVD